MAKSNLIFKINISNWEKHNPGHKIGYKYTRILNALPDHQKIKGLPSSVKWLYIVLLLKCGEDGKEQITIFERTINDQLSSKLGAEKALRLLQSFQLLTYSQERLNRIELNELNELNELITDEAKKPSPAQKKFSMDHESKKIKPDTSGNRRVKEAYCEAYERRYKIPPAMSAKFHANISQIVQRIGIEDAINVAKFYLTHNDGFYLKNTHSIGILLRDCETLRTQMLRGKPITNTDVRNFEKTEQHRNLLEKIDRGEI